MKQRALDVLVVGGGPAGSATAAWCARAGLDVLVVDRARFPRDKACAEYLSPEATRDLDALGITAELESAGALRLYGFRLVSDDGAHVTGRFAAAPGVSPYRPFGYALPRTVLDSLLLEAARTAGAEVREECSLEDIGPWSEGVRSATLRFGAERQTVRARVVVGADGLNSRVARVLRLARRGRLRRLALVAHLRGVSDCADVGEMFVARGRYLGLAPIGTDLVNVAAVIPAGDAGAGFDPVAALRTELARWPELARRTASASLVRRVLVTGPFASRSVSAIADGALLVGDAADFYDPFTGEGIFAALRGGRLAGESIAAALASGPAERRSLRRYARARRKAFAGKWVLERVVAHAATQPALMRRFTHNLARRPGLADLWVAAAGDCAPVSSLFTPARLAAVLI
ncbi:MAG TPA: NAD(P)/FAD-dependent oxidoreductase [Gemmatimonadales bacterium]|nr:NAD(P)/FAD-dependent oxidoreductase [Gemmatimonadales bacterium]